jgi:hypothetical protein
VKIDVKGPWFIQPEGRGWRVMVSESGGLGLDEKGGDVYLLSCEFA